MLSKYFFFKLVKNYFFSCLIFSNTSTIKDGNNHSQLVDLMMRHYRHMQGGGFWTTETEMESTSTFANTLNNTSSTIIPGSDKNRSPTLFEILSTVNKI